MTLWIRVAGTGASITFQVWAVLSYFPKNEAHSQKVSRTRIIVEWCMRVVVCFLGGYFLSELIIG